MTHKNKIVTRKKTIKHKYNLKNNNKIINASSKKCNKKKSRNFKNNYNSGLSRLVIEKKRKTKKKGGFPEFVDKLSRVPVKDTSWDYLYNFIHFCDVVAENFSSQDNLNDELFIVTFFESMATWLFTRNYSDQPGDTFTGDTPLFSLLCDLKEMEISVIFTKIKVIFPRKNNRLFFTLFYTLDEIEKIITSNGLHFYESQIKTNFNIINKNKARIITLFENLVKIPAESFGKYTQAKQVWNELLQSIDIANFHDIVLIPGNKPTNFIEVLTGLSKGNLVLKPLIERLTQTEEKVPPIDTVQGEISLSLAALDPEIKKIQSEINVLDLLIKKAPRISDSNTRKIQELQSELNRLKELQ